MRRKILIVGGIALISATLITLFFYNILADQLAENEPDTNTRTLVVAAYDLPRGALLKAGMLEARKLDPSVAPADGYADIGSLEGRRLVQPVNADEPLQPRHLPKGGDQGLGVAIPNGMRAVTVNVEEYGGVHGVVTTGDRVDVLVASAARAPGRADISLKTLLQNVEVLATDRMREDELKNKISPNVTLLVEAPAAAELSLANQAGAILLVLRNPDDSDTVSASGTEQAHKLLDLPAPSNRRYRPRPTPVARPRPEPPAEKPELSTLARLEQPAPPMNDKPIVNLHLRLAGLGDQALEEMTKGLESTEARSPLLIARFREGWDAEEVFERLARQGALEVFAEPSFGLANGLEAAYEQSSSKPEISRTKGDLKRLGVRLHVGADLAGPGQLLLEIAAQAGLPSAQSGLALRQAESELVLADRQSFWVRGLIDRPGAWDLLRTLFPDRPLERDVHDELVILVTPRLLGSDAERLTAVATAANGVED